MSRLGEARTLCDLLRHSDGRLPYHGPAATPAAFQALVRSYGRGFAEQGYPAGALVLLAVRDPGDLLALTFGAWWAGHGVSFAAAGGHSRPADHSRRDRLAVVLGAALQVCDPADILDEEHVRHRDVPAVPPHELALPPASWPPRCRPEDTAVTLPGRARAESTVSYSHTGLLDEAYERYTSRSADADPVTGNGHPTGLDLVQEAAAALLAAAGAAAARVPVGRGEPCEW